VAGSGISASKPRPGSGRGFDDPRPALHQAINKQKQSGPVRWLKALGNDAPSAQRSRGNWPPSKPSNKHVHSRQADTTVPPHDVSGLIVSELGRAGRELAPNLGLVRPDSSGYATGTNSPALSEDISLNGSLSEACPTLLDLPTVSSSSRSLVSRRRSAWQSMPAGTRSSTPTAPGRRARSTAYRLTRCRARHHPSAWQWTTEGTPLPTRTAPGHRRAL
jgi:hypothetical protein